MDQFGGKVVRDILISFLRVYSCVHMWIFEVFCLFLFIWTSLGDQFGDTF